MISRCSICGKSYSDREMRNKCEISCEKIFLGKDEKDPPDFDIEKKGLKFDDGKADLSLLSYLALTQIAKAFEFGKNKYGRYNYLNGMEWTRVSSALLRHAYAFVWGEDYDKESGLPHLAHCGACCIMLLDFFLLKLGKDDRFKENK